MLWGKYAYMLLFMFEFLNAKIYEILVSTIFLF